jgi:hypothetical protein
MNRTLLTTLMLALLLLFVLSPFAGLASLMVVMLVGAFFFLIGNLFQAIISGDANPKEP